mgnify:CR=1 FL=1|jgi:hypothetical protein
MNQTYSFYSRRDKQQQPIQTITAVNRYHAALFFAKIKRLPLKEFLEIFAISR